MMTSRTVSAALQEIGAQPLRAVTPDPAPLYLRIVGECARTDRRPEPDRRMQNTKHRDRMG